MGAGLPLLVALLWYALFPRVAPGLAVEAAYDTRLLLSRLIGLRWPAQDPWGSRWQYELYPRADVVVVYSPGPNRQDELGGGDDLKAAVGELWSSEPAGAWSLWLVPYVLAFVGWVRVLRIARAASDRTLTWRELGWALACGGPIALFGVSYAWWGADNTFTRDLVSGQDRSLVGWRHSFVLTVAGALFVAAWALSRPPRREPAPPDAPPAERTDEAAAAGG